MGAWGVQYGQQVPVLDAIPPPLAGQPTPSAMNPIPGTCLTDWISGLGKTSGSSAAKNVTRENCYVHMLNWNTKSNHSDERTTDGTEALSLWLLALLSVH